MPIHVVVVCCENIIDFVTIFTKNILTTGKSSSYCIAYPDEDTSNLFVTGA